MENPANKGAEGRVWRLGTRSDATFHLGPGRGLRRDHARIAWAEGRPHLTARGRVLLNGHPVREVQLHDRDLLQFGRDTLVRVHLLDGRLELARAGRAARGPRSVSVVRIGGGVLAFSVLIACAAIVTHATRPAPTRTQGDVRQARRSEVRLERVREGLGEVQRSLARVERGVDARVERAVAESADLKAARQAAARWESERDAAERVIERCAPSVCLIQGAYGFGRVENGKWRFLREVEEAGTDENVPLSMQGKGGIFKVEYTGTGFFAHADGLVLSNRHIAEPWWKNEAATPILEAGFEPKFLYLRAYFPGRDDPVRFDPAKSVTSEEEDLAVLRIRSGAQALPPALPLADGASLPSGRRILLLGYPSGLSALLARAEEEVADELSRAEPFDPLRILDALAQQGLVRPLPTQGHVNDRVGRKLVFDAPSAVGGSGAPVLDLEGRVVAVNYGILKAFDGANFGVPAEFVRPLLERARR
ncbi:MAG: trypsin-like peptidase domain-containing protein [Planctomycetota bacterium]